VGSSRPPTSVTLQQDLRRLAVRTSGEGFTDLTNAINDAIRASGLQQGLLQLVCLHTSCSLTVNENADPRVLHDLNAYLQALVPQLEVRSLRGDGGAYTYRHNDEGPDDMPAHIRTALTCTSLGLSFDRGQLLLGTWQAVYLWEHRARPHRRELSLHLIGS
jgi:secondary thiamine-phosphate synthase enzyme